MDEEKSISQRPEPIDRDQIESEESNVVSSPTLAITLPQRIPSPIHPPQQQLPPEVEELMQSLSRAYRDAQDLLRIAYSLVASSVIEAYSDCTPANSEVVGRDALDCQLRFDNNFAQQQADTSHLAAAADQRFFDTSSDQSVAQSNFPPSRKCPILQPSPVAHPQLQAAEGRLTGSFLTDSAAPTATVGNRTPDSKNYPPLNLSVQVTKRRKYRHESFPKKLHRMIWEAEKTGRKDVISWTPCGNAFDIHNWDVFEKDLIPNYFRHKRMSSFRRQMSMYGFRRVVVDNGFGGFAHEDFHRDRPEQSYLIKRASEVHYKVQLSSAQRDTRK